MKKPKKNKRKCGMYYKVYIPWCFKNNKVENEIIRVKYNHKKYNAYAHK